MSRDIHAAAIQHLVASPSCLGEKTTPRKSHKLIAAVASIYGNERIGLKKLLSMSS